MPSWQVRQEGSPAAVAVPSADDVLAGLRDGVWLPTDEVKGPHDSAWAAIEAHPTFAEAAEELEPPPPEPADETNLDMNPLIDVCLVLLIFFILTITYASLERAIEVPGDQPEEKGSKVPKLDFKDIKDRVFTVTARMDGDKPVVKVGQKVVAVDQLAAEIKAVVDTTGKSVMLLDLDRDVPWGIETAILDAAKGNHLHDIMRQQRGKK